MFKCLLAILLINVFNIQVNSQDHVYKMIGLKIIKDKTGIEKVLPKNDTIGKCEKIFEKRLHLLHNELRFRHGVQPLTLDRNLTAAAKSLTKRMALSQTMNLDGEITYGINKFTSSSSESSNDQCKNLANSFFQSMAKSASNYNYNEQGFTLETGGFTQMVWKSSKKLGCSISFTDLSKPTKSAYAVCYFSPRGNVVGLFKENVLRPKK